MEIITVKDILKTYESYRKEPGLLGTVKALFNKKVFHTHAVKGISFEIKKGEMVGFLGPNGAGKTTTLKMLSGILYPTGGEARVAGFDPQKRQNDFKKRFGIVMGQKDQLTNVLPLMDNLVLFREFYDIPEDVFKKNLDELVDALGLRDLLDVPIRKMSLGQRMKCELVAALIHNPDILFLDEPTIGLDVVAQKNIRNFIKKYNREKKTTIILTSHYMEDIEELCERVIIINFGKIIFDGKLKDLISRYAKDKIIRVTATKEIPMESMKAYGKIEESDGVKIAIRVPRTDVKSTAAKLISSDLPIDDILIEEMPIDDIIREIFQSAN